MIAQQDAQATQKLFNNAKHIRCICHRNPDGDAIGSLLGMGLLLEQQYPNTPISLHCTDPVPETFQFLPGVSRVLGEPAIAEHDVVVFVDCAEPRQTALHESHPELFDGTISSVNIDHHPDNPRFGSVNFIDASAASACEIVGALADTMGWQITPDIATCLLTGVYTDTGGLLHSNTTAKVYRTVARLLRAGARQQAIVSAVFRTASVSTLKLWGRVLEKISITPEGGAISAVTAGDFRATGADFSDLTGAIDYVNAVPGMRFSLILSERNGVVKGSLRTLRDDVDVSEMAGRFSGGGHRKAAGFSLPGSLQPELRWRVVQPTSPESPGPQAPAQS